VRRLTHLTSAQAEVVRLEQRRQFLKIARTRLAQIRSEPLHTRKIEEILRNLKLEIERRL
jgi:phage terminase Nu1 subunit (DNA packaging protein)